MTLQQQQPRKTHRCEIPRVASQVRNAPTGFPKVTLQTAPSEEDESDLGFEGGYPDDEVNWKGAGSSVEGSDVDSGIEGDGEESEEAWVSQQENIRMTRLDGRVFDPPGTPQTMTGRGQFQSNRRARR